MKRMTVFLLGLLTAAAPVFNANLLAGGACSIDVLLDRQERTLLTGLSADGRRILISTIDPDDGSFDVFEIDLDSGQTTQVTDVPNEIVVNDSGQPRQAFRSAGVGAYAINFDRLLALTRANLTGENPNNAINWFLFDRPSDQFTQLTQSDSDSHTFEVGDQRISQFFLSPDGLNLVAEEMQALEDDLGILVVRNLILIDPENGSRQQLTFADRRVAEDDPDYPFQTERFDMDAFSVDGQWMVIKGDPDFTENILTLYHIPTGAEEVLLPGTRDASIFYLSEGAEFAYFASSEDWTGQNPDASREFFRLERSSGQIQQLTNRTAAPLRSFHGEGVSVSRDGSAIAYQIRVTDFAPNGLQTERTVQELRWLDVESGSDVLIASSARVLVVDENGNQDFVGIGILRGGPVLAPDGKTIYYDTSIDLNAGTDMATDLDRVINWRIGCDSSPSRFFPQVGDGVVSNIRFQTNFVVTNAGPATAISLSFFDSQGEPMEVELEDLGRASRFEVPVGRGRTLNLTTAGQDGLKVGYARVEAPSHVDATAVFTRSEADSGLVQYEAGVPLARSMESFSLAVDTVGAKDTGLAMVSTGSGDSAQVQLRLYDQDFQLLAERELTLEAGQHTARFVEELFPDLPQAAEMRGTLTVSGQHPVAAVVLRQGDDPSLDFPLEVPTLTAFPVVEGLPGSSAALLDIVLP